MTVVDFIIFIVLFLLKDKLRASKQDVKREKGEKGRGYSHISGNHLARETWHYSSV